ncbi:MAG: alpha/beta hydrolase [Actinoplanes sp.]
MQFLAETTVDGVWERSFTIGAATGLLWSPAGAPDDRPLVLLAHGGGGHKRSPAVEQRARRYASALGFASVGLDAPGHGDRRTEADVQFGIELHERIAAGRPVGEVLAGNDIAQAVPEWQAVLAALPAAGPVGFLGLSMGAAIGIPLIAATPRISAAVLGLTGSGRADAARITVPIEFVMQWDDELVPRADSLALFDAFGSPEKTLHANPGPHHAVPPHERDSAERFLGRHLN